MTQEQIKPYEGIDMMHMMRRIVKSWWKMLIAMAVLAAALGGLSYYKNAKGLAAAAREKEIAIEGQTGDAVEEIIATSEEEILEQSGLSQKAADEVLYYTNKYYYNKKQYDRQLAYLQDSILMQMDPNNVWTITLYYDLSVSTVDDAKEEKAADSAVAASYIAKISNDEMYGRIAEELGADIDSGYFAEVITGSCLDSLSDVDDVTVISSKEDMKIVVRYSDQAGCEKIAQIIKEQIDASGREVTAEVGTHEISLVGEREEQKSDPELLNDQKNAISALGNLSDNIISARTNIESSEEAVFEQLVEFYEAQDAQKASAIQSVLEAEGNAKDGTDESEETAEEATETIKPRVSKKYVALGLFLGIFLVAVWEACKYFFTDTLKQAKELEEGYGLTVYDSRDKAVIAFVLNSRKEKDGYQNICTVSSEDNPARDEELLKKLMKADAVMLTEKTNVSSHKKIAGLLDLCRKLEKPVIGAIVEE
ncbi:MAG: hypothetical protein ACI4AA_06390 [Lachnospiraceae bacterium]